MSGYPEPYELFCEKCAEKRLYDLRQRFPNSDIDYKCALGFEEESSIICEDCGVSLECSIEFPNGTDEHHMDKLSTLSAENCWVLCLLAEYYESNPDDWWSGLLGRFREPAPSVAKLPRRLKKKYKKAIGDLPAKAQKGWVYDGFIFSSKDRLINYMFHKKRQGRKH